MAYLSPVKINLFLHITDRRSDGFHLLQTLFQFLDYGDEIDFKPTTDGKIHRIDEHPFDLPEQDLCLRAAMLLRNYVQSEPAGVTITLRKKIPPGTGLGAGSSNAATTLMALNHLWQTGLCQNELIKLGRMLGADVPVFLYGQSAWAEGAGDLFTPCGPELHWYCIVIPDVQVSTADIFADPALTRNHPPVKYLDFIDGQTGNDLEAVTIGHYPVVGQALDYLARFGNARMSGTGGAVFVAVENRKLATRILSGTPPGYTGFVARSSNQNPLHQQLKSI
jgi:4-diphosphocytidyl-2-C-methyl-D-erythritol kinase